MLVLLAIVTITIQTVLVFLSLCRTDIAQLHLLYISAGVLKAYRASNNVHLSEYNKNLAHQLLSWYYVTGNNTIWRAEYNEQHKLDRQ